MEAFICPLENVGMSGNERLVDEVQVWVLDVLTGARSGLIIIVDLAWQLGGDSNRTKRAGRDKVMDKGVIGGDVESDQQVLQLVLLLGCQRSLCNLWIDHELVEVRFPGLIQDFACEDICKG